MKGSRFRIVSIVAMALMVVLASALVSDAGVTLKKPYTIDIGPYSVATGSTVTFSVTVTNKTTTQSLGSCNISQAGFSLQSTTQPSQGSAAIVGNVLQLRNLATAPMTSRTVSVVAVAPSTAGSYTWSVECRQSNNFSPDQPSNQFTLDDANSHRVTVVSTPLPSADIAVTGNADSPDPVVGANTVEYTVTVHNFGPATAGPVTLSDSLPNGGSITSVSAPAAWSCSGTGASTTCTHAAIASGVDAEAVLVRVLAPNSNTTITNRASVSQTGATDPNNANNTLDQNTTVTQDSSCASGFVSCGSGRIIYNLFSQVTTGSTPSATAFVVGTTTFQAVTGASGGQIWGMSAPAVPGSFCPVDVSSNVVTQCTWQMNLDPIPSVYPAGATTFVGICYVTKCPQGVVPGAGTIVVKVDDAGNHQILPACNGAGDTNLCFEQQRISGGHLKITVRNLISGDPKLAGICVGGGC